jgi:Lipase maturation factor
LAGKWSPGRIKKSLLDLRRNLVQPFLCPICPILIVSDLRLQVIYPVLGGSKLVLGGSKLIFKFLSGRELAMKFVNSFYARARARCAREGANCDPNWWNLSALSHHFLTQPLPTPLAWYAAHLSPSVLKFATGGMFFIELILPFLIFCPRRLRFFAAFGILLLQSCILITGNYNWFNLQTMLLCLLLFDDAALQKVLPRRLIRLLPVHAENNAPRRAVTVIVSALALLIVFCSLVQMDERFGGSPPAVAQAVDRLIEPLHIVSGYGLFAVMTTERDEIVIEGSYDGVAWREYEFRYKPGDVARRPRWSIAHQPRLDWQMWFAALDDPRRLPWFFHFLQRLLENEPAVTALLEENPFPDKPPVYVRAQFYDYTYVGSEEKAKGLWWDRRSLGLYFPMAQLKGE